MKTFAITLCAVAGLAAAGSVLAAQDDFNRAKLGRRWVEVAGHEGIHNNRLRGKILSLDYNTRSSGDNKTSAEVILNGTGLQYGAVAVGDVANGTNAFLKIQEQNGDGMFEYGGFYLGNNGGVDFFALNSPVPSPATLTGSVCGTVATMRITSSAGVQVYKFDYGTSVGTGGGLGVYGPIALDNYKSHSAGCASSEKGVWIRKGARPSVQDLSLAK